MSTFFMTDLEQSLAGEDSQNVVNNLQSAFEQEINQFKAKLRRPSTTDEFNRNNASLEVFTSGLDVLNEISQ